MFKALWILAPALLLFACNEAPRHPKDMPQRTPLEPTARLSPARKATGQTMYVPIYSTILEGRKETYLHLSAHLSVRNVSNTEEIVLASVDYYDNHGKLVRRYIEKPTKLGPMASVDFFLPAHDLSGGTAASFLVEWEAERPTPLPVIQGIMVSTQGTQGVSFITEARVVESH